MSGLTNPSPATNLKFDASNNVLANINAQAINPNINNPYLPTLLTHQTALSATISTALTPVNIGASITVTRAGLLKIALKGHVNAGVGIVDFTLTRNSVIFYYIEYTSGAHSSTKLGDSAIPYDSLYGTATGNNDGITATAASNLQRNVFVNSASPNVILDENIPVLNGDVIQFRVSNTVAADITYIDDLEVMLQ